MSTESSLFRHPHKMLVPSFTSDISKTGVWLPCQRAVGLLVLVLISLLLLPSSQASLCARCETTEVLALKRYYGTLQVDAVTFRGFVANLLSTMENMPQLATLRGEIMELIHRYDDCVRTCEIPFTKRAHEDVVALKLWLGQREAQREDDLDMILRRGSQQQQDARDSSISILISPDIAENLIRRRQNLIRKRSTETN